MEKLFLKFFIGLSISLHMGFSIAESMYRPDPIIGDNWIYGLALEGNVGTDQERHVGSLSVSVVRTSRETQQILLREILLPHQSNTPPAQITLLVTDFNWNLLSRGNTLYKPYYPLYDWPLEPGKAWEMKFQEIDSFGNVTNKKMRAKVRGVETISGLLKNYSTLRVDYEESFLVEPAGLEKISRQYTRWYHTETKRFVQHREVTNHIDYPFATMKLEKFRH